MSTNANVLMYFLQAGLVVKTVMFLLIAASITTWALIIQRTVFFARLKSHTEAFIQRFWDSSDLSTLYADVDKHPEEKEGVAAIFYAGFKEFVRARKQGRLTIEPIQRVMQISHAKEAEHLESYLPFFASVGSIATYVGLFGTVWGIMASIQALGQAQQAAFSMVAPGIAEALVATALGLFTAIPAVLAYNRFTVKANKLLNQFDLFQEELISLIEQQSNDTSQG